ncbi:hypothetical protein BACCAP_02104 [Pseudoflavonifractor capillosus ATCC 29799]|uniref:Uncharacterized protein n=1 Tax=Pseudoflavonifractor capillosus ATCC 29799 TaxID=411467 RepID=A6NV69_9FIRM|nr:hypothetical protein BACCAP_02104 [Pseudoflavonifractor capillosus ATCC 29799]
MVPPLIFLYKFSDTFIHLRISDRYVGCYNKDTPGSSSN